MQSIRRKIKLVICLLAMAIGISTVIYSRGGFSVTADKPVDSYVCGTPDPVPLPAADAVALRGEILFKANCISCHSMTKEIFGPALVAMGDRAPYKGFIEDWLLRPKLNFEKKPVCTRLAA